MAAPAQNNDNFRRHLEAEEGREIVYCHLCNAQWYRDSHGLICPACEGDIIEIVSGDSDPRPPQQNQRPPTPPEFSSLRTHYPFNPYGDESDPEEADIDEHIRHNPDGYTFTRHTHSHSPLRAANDRRRGMPEENIMGDFQSMIANMMGPQLSADPQGRSGVHVYTSGGDGGGGPRVTGARWTWSTGGPGRGMEQQTGEPPGLEGLFSGIFGPMGPTHGPAAQPGMPPGLAGLFAAILNPANARSGDAVYTQEALDNIISQLMEQNTSNAPGPAAEEAINSLPKKKLDEEMLGPEHKGECSVCMDDVTIGDEVVVLPCKHWFHQQCASIWLKEHNTCPICRKGIEGDSQGAGSDQAQGQSQSQNQSQRSPLQASGARRLSEIRSSSAATATTDRVSPTTPRRMESLSLNATAQELEARRAARMEAYRNATERAQSGGGHGPIITRIHVIGDGYRHTPPTTSRRSSGIAGNRRTELRRNSDRANSSSRRESRQPILPPRRTSTSHSQNNNNSAAPSSSLAGSALGWLRNRFAGNENGSGSSSSARK